MSSHVLLTLFTVALGAPCAPADDDIKLALRTAEALYAGIQTETLPNDGDGTGTGESGQGGAGDEQAAETLALFTGKNGAITPSVVRVPAFISVRVELRSADGGAYELTFGDKKIAAGGELSSRSTTFEGLRPGAKLVGTGTGGKVRIEATAEPGP